jgi:hypothetical protein
LQGALYRPAAVCTDGATTYVLLEGHPADVEVEARRCALAPSEPVPWPVGAHRGRISVAPAHLDRVVGALADVPGCRWLAEYGVGTVHVAGDRTGVLADARAVAHQHGGWLLREAGGGDDFDGFGIPLPNAAVHRRIKDAFDPDGKCNPGRLPL